MEQLQVKESHWLLTFQRTKMVLPNPQDRTVLLVIDPVNDFLSEGGAAWELTKKTLKMNNLIENLQRVTAGARAKGIPVFLTRWLIQKKIMQMNICIKEVA